mgnify:CR=1 FL=1
MAAPGAAAVVVQGGQQLYFTSSGLARAPNATHPEGVPFNERTVVRIASNTKLFTTLAAYQLRDQGYLSMDDPVSKWLPDFAVQQSDAVAATSQVRL